MLGAAAAWTLVELVSSGRLAGIVLFGIPVAVAVFIALLPRKDWGRTSERWSWVLLGAAFFANRAFIVGVEVTALAGFLTLLVVVASVQRLEGIFGEAYRAAGSEVALVHEIDRAFGNAAVRSFGGAALALALTLVAANAVSLGFAPFTSLATIFVLALVLIAIVWRLARGGRSEPSE